MTGKELLKYASFGLTGLITVLLIAATILEKMYGSGFAYEEIYTSPFTIVLWCLLTAVSATYIIRRHLWKHVASFCLHLSFVLILAGAMVTHLWGEQGRMHLRADSGEPSCCFITADEDTCDMPFTVILKSFELKNYAGTSAPMDYISTIEICDRGERSEATVSMNNIHRHRSYRFYQSGFDRDGQGATLAVSHDPWGIMITYSGYLLLILSMAGFFFQKGSRFRSLLNSPALKKTFLILILAGGSFNAVLANENVPKTISREAADAFGDMYFYYNDRICPLQTFARDFTVKIYGKPSYKGLTCEQVLAGWFFFPESWRGEPMIKIKGADAKVILGVDGKYASLDDFLDRGIYKLESALQNMSGDNIKNIHAANEKFSLITMVCATDMLDLDRSIALLEQAEQIRAFAKMRMEQASEGAVGYPSEAIFQAEKLYNSSNLNKPLAMFCLTVGILAFLAFCLSDKRLRWLRICLTCICVAVFGYLTFHIGLRWFISGHVPLSNGYETMQFMAWCSLILCISIRNRFRFALPVGILLCGAAMLVSMMGEANPRITLLMPVLQSPLLSIHVMVIMVSYVLFAFMMLNGVAAFIISARGGSIERVEYLQTVSNIMLYPAVFLLTAGIFIGAVWANISWGRYWGWDPKEVWALITMLVYSLGLHAGSLKWFRKPMNFHLFCILAFISVLITYFGVNFLLGGLHSYA